MTDELNITLRIADLGPIALTIARNDEEATRAAQYRVNELFKLLHKRYPQKDSKEILALVAIQFALLGVEADNALKQVAEVTSTIETLLDTLLGTGIDIHSEP